MRQLLVKHFALGTWVILFGVKFHFLRASRVLFPATVFTGLIVTGDPSTWTWHWYTFVVFGIYLVLLWIGGGWFPFSYFRIWPAQIDEMDDEQQFDYLRAIAGGKVKNPVYNKYGGLTMTQNLQLKDLTLMMERRYPGRFHNLYNLLPLLISLLAIVGYYLYWG